MKTLTGRYISKFSTTMADPSFLIGAVFIGLDTDQPMILSNDLDFSDKVNSLGARLAKEGRHPGIQLADRCSKPVDLVSHRNDFSEVTDATTFIDSLVEDEIKGAVYIPLETTANHQSMVVVVSRREDLSDESVFNVSRQVSGYLSGVLIPGLEFSARVEILTSRERQCLVLTAHGQTEKDVAQTLGISTSTVQSHMTNARVKLRAKNKAHAVSRAISTHELSIEDLL